MDDGLRIINTVDNSQLEQSFRQAQQTIRESADVAVREGDRIDHAFEKIGKAAAAMLAAHEVRDFIQNVVQIRGEFQQLEVAFNTMLGSVEKANALMEQLTNTAAKTPFDLKGVTDGAKQLLAYGVAAEDVNDTLIHLGDIAAGLSLPLGDLVYLYGTTITQGRMYTQDLRQFMGRGIPLAEELAKQFGVTKDKVQELVTSGKVGAEEFKKAIMDMSSEGGKFGGLMEAQSKTITGQISNIEDAVDVMFNNIGKQSEGIINGALSTVSSLVENYEKVGKVLAALIATYGAYKAAVMVTIAIERVHTANLALQAAGVSALTAKEIIHYNWLVLCQKAQALLNKTMLANPYVAVGTVVVGLTAAIWALSDSTTSEEKAHRSLEKTMEDLAEKQRKYNEETENAIQLAQDDSAATLDRDGAMQILIERYPEIIQKYIDEQGHLKNIIALKKEIAELDGQRTREQKTEELRKAGEDAWNKYNRLAYFRSRQLQANNTFSDEERAEIKMLRDAYEAETGNSGSLASLETIRDYYQSKASQGRERYQRQVTENMIDNFTKEGGSLEKMTDEMLKNLQHTLEQSLTGENGNKTQVAPYIDPSAWLTADDRRALLTRVNGMVTARNQPKSTVAQQKQKAKEDWEAAKKALDDFDKSTNELTTDTARKEREKLQQAVTDAEKVYKQYGGKTTTTGGKGNEAERRRKEQERNQREYESKQRDYARRRQDLEMELSQSIVDVEKDAATKELMQLQQDHKNQVKELEREKEDYIQKKIELEQAKAKANGQTYTTPTNKADVLDEEEQRIFAQREKNLQERQAKETADFYKRQNAALYDYIKEYGSIYQQKEAIAKEYEQKIADETDAIQKATLEKERDRLINELNMKVLRKSIDWETVFNDLNRLSTDYLRDLRDKLRTALREGNLDAKDAEVISAKILEIENRITDKTDFWSSLIPALKERVRLTNEVAEAEERIKDARGKADRLQNKAVGQISAITGTGEGVIRQVWNSLSHEPKDILEYFGIDATSDKGKELTATLIDLTQATEEATDAEKHKANVNEMLKGGKIGDIFSNAVDAAGGGAAGIISVINSNAQSMSELVDKVGLENTDFGQAVHGFSEGVGGFQSAVQSLANGDVVGAVNGVLDGIAGFGKMGINALIGGGNEDENEKEIEELTKSQDRLTNAINGLAEKILKSDATNEQSVEYYKKAYDAEKEWEEKQRKKIDDRASEYANTGYGFLGLSGKSSFNAHMAGNGWVGWQEFSNILREHNGENGITHDSVNKNNIWDLSPEEMKLLMEFAPKRWEELFNGDGHRNPEDLVNEYIERAGELEKLTSALNEKLTGYSWDGFFDSYKSLLKDMTSSTEDFADHINEIITNALIESFVNEELKDDIKELYEYIAEHAQDGIDKEEQAEIERRNKAIEEKGLRWRQTMIDSGRIKTDDEYKQQASTKGFQAMSQDTGNELNGRFTAIQIGVYDIKDLAVKGQEMMAEMKNTQGNISTRVEAIQEAIALSNVHLSKIEKHTKNLEDFGDILEEIRDNTKKI